MLLFTQIHTEEWGWTFYFPPARCDFMKLAIIIFSIILINPTFSFASETWRNAYYMGEGVKTLPNGVTIPTVYLLEKLVVPEENWFSEDAMIVYPSGCTNSGSFKMLVQKKSFSIENDYMNGQGQLEGVPWEWTYFKLEVKMNNGSAKIVIEDFMATLSILSARKIVSNIDGTQIFETWDISLREISKTSYDILKEAILPRLQTVFV